MVDYTGFGAIATSDFIFPNNCKNYPDSKSFIRLIQTKVLKYDRIDPPNWIKHKFK